ncbi:N-acetyl-gamma-glutamyl-phosphate reductase [Albibacterium sp.]|uniref:N-acetyl-gamma-glutamyl-phosphate reductase n=1 Tax=Albibacterium sp. TaxID=2952885 RepID=UPI002BEC6C7B|nr:N-acetyl-gamma-glutamyl-phosphate reductase [Albibacterium sp.]HUH19840.1 N-acetyl-gamma-glutamyl-phosphate reductase [Albibacterium sp.]
MNSQQKIRIGIVGSAGYTGGELIRLLIYHPDANIVFAHSESNGGNPISSVHTDLIGETDLLFSNNFSNDIDVLFLCVGHGNARKFLSETNIPQHIRIIDLSQDFRLAANSHFQGRDFIYGLPELQRDKIKIAHNIANAGCFATTIELALLPLANKGLINSEVHVNATTGSTGAGQNPSPTSHYSWRNDNLSAYKIFEHQHLLEIGETLSNSSQENPIINFIPQRGAFSRGIFATSYIKSDLSIEEAYTIYEEFYRSHPFTHVSRNNIDLKLVVNTNKCLLHLVKYQDKLLIISMTDNLLKGASGQAVQNMNIMFDLDEHTGLNLKSSVF